MRTPLKSPDEKKSRLFLLSCLQLSTDCPVMHVSLSLISLARSLIYFVYYRCSSVPHLMASHFFLLYISISHLWYSPSLVVICVASFSLPFYFPVCLFLLFFSFVCLFGFVLGYPIRKGPKRM
ncbi:MAG: hypothetical protein J3R72DRAFT_454855 [Linnemannia gamsii]|nr:MAG: hypothetical protein J3R72DRAFT_454855 [Linnemannia gamsii]